ncbi:MAG: hypothetical protein VKO21_00665 [Candidatus Sericytochromatia bacterium]|nr:hypothetical protein [Candidatus Sericytochromatia bacterium]
MGGCSADQLARIGLLRTSGTTASAVDCPDEGVRPEGCVPAEETDAQDEASGSAAAATATPIPTASVTPAPLFGRVDYGEKPKPSTATPVPFPSLTPVPGASLSGSIGD